MICVFGLLLLLFVAAAADVAYFLLQCAALV